MGRRKVSMGLLPRRGGKRVSTFVKRKEGLKKKAHELSVLCGVDVALVVADGDGGVAAAAKADVWESKEGVLARYRELDPEVRARHTLREYLGAELGKEEAKLARVRQAGPDGLHCWDKALEAVATAEEARSLLGAIDAAIIAAGDRRRALGLPVDDGDGDGKDGIVVDQAGIPPFCSAPVDDEDGGYLMLQHALGGGGGDGGNGHQDMGMWPCSADGNNMMQYGFQQFNSSGNVVAMEGYDYDLQMVPDMYSGGGGGFATEATAYHYDQTHHAAAMQHGHGYVFPCARAGGASYFGVPSSGVGYHQQMQQQQVVDSGAAAQHQPNLAAMSSANEPCHAMVPPEYLTADTTSLNYMDTKSGVHGSGGTSFAAMDARGNFINAPPAFSVAMIMSTGGGGGGNFISAPPAATPSQAMGGASSDNFTPAQPLAMSYGGDMTIVGAGGYTTQSGVEQLHYLGDMENTQPNHPWGIN